MRIERIKSRKDGKFLVTIGFNRDLKNLHKVMTHEQIETLKLQCEDAPQCPVNAHRMPVNAF